MKHNCTYRSRPTRAAAFGVGAATLAFAAFGMAATASASEFQIGEVDVVTQVTISSGFGIRMQDRDPRLICPQNIAGGTATTCNGDDGNLNFDVNDPIFATIKAQGEVTLNWQNFTVYGRAQGFYDGIYDNGDLATSPGVTGYRDLSGRQTAAARHVSSHDYELMDLWVRGRFPIGSTELTAKLGLQSISWGEALVTPLSLAQVNSFDQSKLRTPGAEIRDAVRSMPAAVLTYDVGGGVTLEAFYQFDFRSSVTDPAGSFFSTTDVGGKGGAGFGGSQDFDQILPDGGGISVPLGPKFENNSNGDNFGVAMRYFSPELNNTEFGFYFANITPRSPVPSFLIGSGENFITGAELATDPAIQARLVTGAVQNFLAANPGATPAQIAAVQAAAAGNLAALATADNAKNSQIVLTNPGDTQMFGFSFNTTIDWLGISVAGETAYMKDLPVLIDGETYATSFVCGIVPAGGLPCNFVGRGNQLSTFLGTASQFEGGRVDGYLIKDVQTFLLRGIKSFGASDLPARILQSNSVNFLAEFGAVYSNLPDENVLAMEAPGNGLPGAGAAVDPTDPLASKHKAASDWSGGVTAVLSASYPDALFGANLTPSIRFQTGLFGNTPLTGGYVEHASALAFQIDAEYLLAWKASLGYTNYFGGGRQNLLNDRDFFQMTVSYSF